MSLEVDLQIASDFANLPSAEQFQLWAEKALLAYKEEAEVTIRIADEAESQELNSQYRGKDKPTNVLSFPFEAPPGIELPLVGDLIICPQVVFREAEEQEKTFHDHFAHMVVHGCLHLLGFDHINEQDADEMESLEKEFLADLGIADPYRDDV
ncbi:MULTISPECIES: rRNA maturation RNase YbeY [Pseudoalteromonas]|jgi:probable rRNA maturation factor|uniref:Endoribonuclease YbeY n=2 Tax=Pseudoalteromonas TaxID=53246 RepID=A0A0F4R3D9_9GAMM|nr:MULTISPECIES: rRNA maturation RNase YbeY [Pseudoalteromonas]AZZ97276.1 rRNA maturation RNase YbeY [Pseudoalteromonas sp. R3]KJZ13332.1 endoribonuclease YbeY [Pseudoalteromonas rubra]MCF2907354.1 rRNA maturation RNase YbeY [Pseudoalteromonas sp. DL2-H2.2]MCG7535372.1 rRNA maturation RNase YbeY [Pseudoalteromonas sp. OOF1S-7]MEC4091076.1 rRNA maturation RNase YbeY [Pseudoalteromonas rubra]